MKIGYTAVNKDGKKTEFFAVSSQAMANGKGLDAQNYITNNFDHSQGPWNYYPNGKFQHSK